ncbi:hypothetical protein [Cohnella sp. AR92]|uniref:hypothetical protein n=1 Tax=Cohnella sp. AR92 TaxID=648716 RepID=UPI000F8D6DE8|nr:hypothetical protein [Cohnella sp. AR92]RUS47583.1 hypothetical protein ELR57_07265 [Cohnella sp. AR92]
MKKAVGVAVLLGVLLSALLAGCSNGEIEAVKADPARRVEEAPIRIVRNGKEAGPGPLTNENVSIAGIRIGDSQDQVRGILGEPSSFQNGGGGSPDIWWTYEERDLSVSFYRTGEKEPAGGVDAIKLNSASKMRSRNSIGIGSTRKEILAAYPEAVQSESTAAQGLYTLWITGMTESEGFHTPTLILSLSEDKVTHMELTTFLTDPDR